jgi:RNA polymerase sigma factor (sigma-70 family)
MSNPSLDIETTLRLVRGAKSGDRKSLEDLFARYLPKVRRIVALRLGCTLRDFAAYEDMVQEGLLRAFEKLEQFQELSEGGFYNWISTCVASAMNLRFRKQDAAKRGGGREKPFADYGEDGLADSILAGTGPGPRTRASQQELQEKLEAALLSLKTHHREVIILRHLCGMQSDEIACTLGFASAATARKVIERAVAELRRKLGPEVLDTP